MGSENGEDDLVPVVIDHGTFTIKAGYSTSGTYAPTVTLPGSITMVKGAEWGLPRGEENADEEWNAIERAWRRVFEELGGQPREHPVIITQDPMAPKSQKKRIQEILFNKMGVPAIYTISSPVLVAYSYGAFTGLIVDIGHTSCRVVPIINGFVFDHAIKIARHLGGLSATRFMYKTLGAIGGNPDGVLRDVLQAMSETDGMNIARKIKEQLAVCVQGTKDYKQAITDNKYERKYTVTERKKEVKLCKELIDVGEMLFHPQQITNDRDGSIIGLHQLIARAIDECDLDVRTELYSNILPSGAASLINGLPQRLAAEMKELVPHAANAIAVKPDPNRQHAVWSGGAVLTTIEQFQQKWEPKWEYEQGVDREHDSRGMVSTAEDDDEE